MKRTRNTVLLAIGIATLATACSSETGGAAATSESPAAASSEAAFALAPAKEWTVDTSGWWVPDDPTGCLNETTTCTMSAWPYRQYGGDIASNIMTHGDTISLYCKAPTPAAIRNPIKTESVYWYYADYQGTAYWIPDVYVTKDDITGMAAGVPDCPSNTPGINGSGTTPAASPTAS